MPAPRQTQGFVRAPSAAFSRTLLLAPDLQQTILAELDSGGPNRFAYTPYGSHSSPFAAQGRLGFNGQVRERPTDWYHLGNGHRTYSPVLMRFHSPDRLSPFGKGGWNAYVYCKGDPVNFEDPTGQYGEAIARLIQLSATTALHAGIVTTNLVGAKAAGWMLHAARMSTVASTTAIVGTVGQLAGWPAAVYVSNVATTVSAMATMVRYAPAITNGFRAGTLWATVRSNLRNLAWGTAFPKPQTVTSPPSPGRGAAEHVDIPMSLVPLASPASQATASTGQTLNGTAIRRGGSLDPANSRRKSM